MIQKEANVLTAMPHTSYALMGGIRSHRIDSPQIHHQPQKNEKPNACNLCHLDQTLQWTADALSQWYGHDAIKLNSSHQDVAASVTWPGQCSPAAHLPPGI